jgi:hypothetical protein
MIINYHIKKSLKKFAGEFFPILQRKEKELEYAYIAKKEFDPYKDMMLRG